MPNIFASGPVFLLSIAYPLGIYSLRCLIPELVAPAALPGPPLSRLTGLRIFQSAISGWLREMGSEVRAQQMRPALRISRAIITGFSPSLANVLRPSVQTPQEALWPPSGN